MMELRNKFIIICKDCNKVFNNPLLKKCPDCKGMIDFIYNLKEVKINNSNDPNIRYFDLIPIIDRKNLVEVTNQITPLIHAEKIGRIIEFQNLYLKNETFHPTKTTKDRMATIGLSFFKENKVKEFVITSTGNSSTSYATGGINNKNFKIHIFVGEEFLDKHNFPKSKNIVIHLIKKDFVETGEEAKKFAESNEIHLEGGAFNPARREGLKLAYLESFDQMKNMPNYIFQAVSSGMGLIGAYKGIKEYESLGRIKKIPKIVCCQQESCNPMVRAWKENSSIIKENHKIKNPKGLAKAILRGDPTGTYPYLYKIVKETKGNFIDVSNAEMEEAKNLAKKEGLDICYASATALASAIKMIRNKEIKNNESILVNITGGNRNKN